MRRKRWLCVDYLSYDTFRHWSLSQLAERLNVEGYRTEKGKQFTKVQVKRMLDRESFYRGIYTYGQIQANGKHPAIIL